MKQSLFLVFGLLFWSSCNNTVATESAHKNTYYNIDSLLNAQILLLKNAKAKLNKTYRHNDGIEEVMVDMDSGQWANALSLFRILDINRPALKTAYNILDNISDSSSNLTILQYQVKDKNQLLKEINFYYLESIENLKKIVAKSSSRDFIHHSDNILKMILRQYHDQTYINSYSISTAQKTLFRDSSYVHIDLQVIY